MNRQASYLWCREALNNYNSASLAGQAPITVFTGLPAYNPLAVVLQGSDAISFKQSKMKPDEVLALVTDQKESLEELHKKVGTKHHFTTAYSRKSNGTVERVNREIMQVLRSLVSEFKISWNEWASLLPTFGAECLEQLQVSKPGRTSSYHSFNWSSCVQSSCSCSPRL